MDDNDLALVVTRLLPAPIIERLAQEHGLIKRRRVVEIVPLVWGLVLASLTTTNSSLAAWRRFIINLTGWNLRARSSFYDRLTPGLTRLFKDLLLRALLANRRSTTSSHWLEPALSGLDSVLAIDSSVINLRDDLRSAWKACAKAKSALKLHAVVNVLDFQLHRVQLSSQKAHDILGVARVASWARGKLLLMDLGYYSFDVFETIDQSGGYFLSRMKSSTNPVIIEDLHRGAGRLTKLKGSRVRRAAKKVSRRQLDVRVRLSSGFECRAVGLRNEEEGTWHWYLTNLPVETYPAEYIGEIYRLRWQVELVFKQLKSQESLDVQTSTKKHRVELKMWVSLLGYVLAGRLCEKMRASHEGEFPVWRALEALKILGAELAREVCRDYIKPARSLGSRLVAMSRDPNVSRRRAYSGLAMTCDDSQL